MNSVNRIQNEAAWNFSDFSRPLDRTIDRISSQATVQADSVFQSSASTALYIIENAKKRLIPSMDAFQKLGYSLGDIVTVHPSFLASIPTGQKKLATGTLIQDAQGKIYMVKDESRLYVPDVQTFENYGLSSGSITKESDPLLASYPDIGTLFMRFRIGSSTYMVDNRTLWTIPGANEAHFGISGSTPTYNVLMLQGLTAQVTATRFVKNNSGSIIYYIENGQKRPIGSWAQLVALGGEQSVITLSTWATGQFPTGSPI
jgi:hypothetical protein